MTIAKVKIVAMTIAVLSLGTGLYLLHAPWWAILLGCWLVADNVSIYCAIKEIK